MSTLLEVLAAAHVFTALPLADDSEIPADKIRLEIFRDREAVGITIYTKQPDNEAFKESFFVAGRAVSYTGCWMGDGGLIGSLPYDNSPYR